MIDKRFQHRGLGKEAFENLLEHITDAYDVDTIELSCGNPIALHLYRSFGFEMFHNDDHEYHMRLKLI